MRPLKIHPIITCLALIAGTFAYLDTVCWLTPWQKQVELVRQESSVEVYVTQALKLPPGAVHAFRTYLSSRISYCLVEVSQRDVTKHFDPVPDVIDEDHSFLEFEWSRIKQSPEFAKMKTYLPASFHPKFLYHSRAGRMYYDPKTGRGILYHSSSYG